jgi:hypothetical protein
MWTATKRFEEMEVVSLGRLFIFSSLRLFIVRSGLWKVRREIASSRIFEKKLDGMTIDAEICVGECVCIRSFYLVRSVEGYHCRIKG